MNRNSRVKLLILCTLCILTFASLRTFWASPRLQVWLDIRNGNASYYKVTGAPGEVPGLTKGEQHLENVGVRIVGTGCRDTSEFQDAYNFYILEHYSPSQPEVDRHANEL